MSYIRERKPEICASNHTTKKRVSQITDAELSDVTQISSEELNACYQDPGISIIDS